jgi:hypothetical protein
MVRRTSKGKLAISTVAIFLDGTLGNLFAITTPASRTDNHQLISVPTNPDVRSNLVSKNAVLRVENCALQNGKGRITHT